MNLISLWKENPNTRKMIGVAILVVIVLVLCIGAYHYISAKFEKPKEPPAPTSIINLEGKPAQQSDPKIVYIQGKETVVKQVEYREKEIDPSTGKKEKTDVQIDKSPKVIYVLVNGKQVEIPSTVSEDAKFENGKLVMTEQTELRLDIRAPKPAFNVGIGWSNKGPAGQINGPLYKETSWWVYGDKETAAGGVQFPIHK